MDRAPGGNLAGHRPGGRGDAPTVPCEFAAGILRATSARVVEVRITRLVAGIYYAVVIIDGPAGTHELDARPSDALNLAVVTAAPIRVAAEIFDDPSAMDRPEWNDYTNRAPQIVSEMRRELESDIHAAGDITGQEGPTT